MLERFGPFAVTVGATFAAIGPSPSATTQPGPAQNVAPVAVLFSALSARTGTPPPDPRIQVQEVSFDWGRPFEEALGPLNYGCEGVGDML